MKTVAVNKIRSYKMFINVKNAKLWNVFLHHEECFQINGPYLTRF